MQANVTSDASQALGFAEKVSKEIITEAGSDYHLRPSPGDVVTLRVAQKSSSDTSELRTWTVGSSGPKLVAGVDLDVLVRTMRCTEQCSAFVKGGESSVVLITTLLSLERAEDLTADGRLVRTTVREGSGHKMPRPGTELKVRFSWRAYDSAQSAASGSSGKLCLSYGDSKLNLAYQQALPDACIITVAGKDASEIATSDEMCQLRRDLRRHLPGRLEVVTQIKLDGKGAISKITHGDRVLLDESSGSSVSDASAKVLKLLGATSASPSREAKEVLIKVGAPSINGATAASSLLEMAQLQASLDCKADDWLPGPAGILAISDMRQQQRSLVRVNSDLAFGAKGLPDAGILPNTALEYDIELLAVMTFEDVSLDKSGNVIKKTTRDGEGYDKPSEGADVTISCEVLDDESGAVLSEEQELTFKACDGRYCSALEETLLTMKKGEVCEVRCTSPSVCTDKELKLSPGPSAAVVFRIELKDFEKIAMHTLADAERVAICEKRKDMGNKFIKEQNWLRALKRYQYAATCLRYLEHWQDADSKGKALKLRCASNTNAAVCHLKLGDWKEAVTVCDAALKDEPENVKALLRRGNAYLEIKEYRDAARDLRKVLEMEKDNAQARQLLAKAKQSMKSEVENEKKMFSKMVSSSQLDKSSEPPASKESKEVPFAPPVDGPKRPRAESTSSDDGEDSCFYMVGAAALLAAGVAGILWNNGRLNRSSLGF